MLSIVIPTTRDISKLLDSLSTQTCKDFEVLVQYEDGLVNARNSGWRRAKGDYVSFIDDDVVLDKNWVKEVLHSFKLPGIECIGAVIGKVITEKGNRDNDWSNPILKKFFGMLNVEACNMSFQKQSLEILGGFDEVYSKGVGEWSEPDIIYKIKKNTWELGLVTYNQFAELYHYPSPVGIYSKRSSHSYHRMRNFHTFRKRWLKWNFNLILVIGIFYTYWIYKFLKTRDYHWLGGLLALRGYE